MTYLWSLHMLTHLIHSKTNIRSRDRQVDQFANYLPIQLCIFKQLILFNLPSSRTLYPSSRGVLAIFPPSTSVSFSISIVYFLCDMNKPSLDLHISIPRKYFISPKSLISNTDLRNSLVS